MSAINHRDGITIHDVEYIRTSKAIKRSTNTTGHVTVFGITQDGHYTLAFEEDIHHNKMDFVQATEAYRVIGERLRSDAREILTTHVMPQIIHKARDIMEAKPTMEYFNEHPGEYKLIQKLVEGYKMMVEGDGMPIEFVAEIVRLYDDLFPNAHT